MRLLVEDLAVEYDGVRALQGVTLAAEPGSIVALVGSNGAGKTTLLRTISGLIRSAHGSIRFGDEDITRLPAHLIVRRGIAHVPEGRHVFASVTVRDNLLLGAYGLRDRAERERRMNVAFESFPRLRERMPQRASTLSGGEQQMLAIARGTMSAPSLLMLDEPSLGIAPKLIPTIYEGVKRIAAGGTTVLLVEQNVRDALALADWAYVIQTGRIAIEGPASDLLDDPRVQRAFLGL